MYHINVKDLLDIYQKGCGPFCVSVGLLTDGRLKRLSNTEFVYIFSMKDIFTSAFDAQHQMLHAKIGHDILLYVSICRRSERDRQFLLEKNHRENILKVQYLTTQRCVYIALSQACTILIQMH